MSPTDINIRDECLGHIREVLKICETKFAIPFRNVLESGNFLSVDLDTLRCPLRVGQDYTRRRENMNGFTDHLDHFIELA